MTYREAEERFNIPSSTIHEMVNKGIKDLNTTSMLYVIAEANRRGLNVQEYIEKYRRTHPTSEDIAREIHEEQINKASKK